MINNKTVLATICARGGSKGIKYKNIKKLLNKPLILYTLELLEKSKYIDDYVISTDDENIINICKRYGYKIDFIRPAELAKDKISRLDVVKHAGKWKSLNEKKYDIVVDLGVATPFKTAIDVDSAIETLVNSNMKRVTSVTISDRNPYYNMLERINGNIRLSKEIQMFTDRRDAPEVYDMNDGINVWEYDWLSNVMLNDIYIDCEVYQMPAIRSIDIDTPFDFRIAELILEGGLFEV